MIIVEGPDGAGKTTLLEKLCDDIPELVRGPRASRSKEGPVENIADWARDDVLSWPDRPLSIYDRHPLISDTIYAPLLRGGMDPGIFNLLGSTVYQKFLTNSLVIFCLPLDRQVVVDNVTNDPTTQMPGVADNAGALWDQYRGAFQNHVAMSRLNPNVRVPVLYDYTMDPLYLSVYMSVLAFKKERS